MHNLVFTIRGDHVRIISVRRPTHGNGTNMDESIEGTGLTFDEIVASGMNFDEISAKYGEETAINVGIAKDPDQFELDDKWFANARPTSEVHPELVERWRNTRGKQKAAPKQRITIRLDADVVESFRSSGKGWQSRLNATLRRAVFGG